MRSLLAIFTLCFLASLQVASACNGHGISHLHEEHIHVEKSNDGVTDVIILVNDHHHHHDNCDCICHDSEPVKLSSLPSPRIDIETPEFVEVLQWSRLADFDARSNKAPPIATNISLPPPSAAELCSQHCRFLL
ncbi:hypothetical protein ACFPK9_01775 [Rubritalea spongiae]|uniref:DUF2946 domain-containing protein n=1 Tax=Rubritalea spongiae TaxID=430797 RepID=A0ABW5E6J6_9BACT